MPALLCSDLLLCIAAALAFPVGFDSTGAPFALQLAAPAGQDGFLLSLGLALEKLFGAMPPPPTTAACSGCSSNVFYANAGPVLCCSPYLFQSIFGAMPPPPTMLPALASYLHQWQRLSLLLCLLFIPSSSAFSSLSGFSAGCTLHSPLTMVAMGASWAEIHLQTFAYDWGNNSSIGCNTHTH